MAASRDGHLLSLIAHLPETVMSYVTGFVYLNALPTLSVTCHITWRKLGYNEKLSTGQGLLIGAITDKSCCFCTCKTLVIWNINMIQLNLLFHLPVCLSLNAQMSSYLCLAECPGLKVPQVVRHLHFQAQQPLEKATYKQQGKFGELVLPSLQSVAWQMVETLHLAQLFGKARMDKLLQEMLLGKGAKGRQVGDTVALSNTILVSVFITTVFYHYHNKLQYLVDLNLHKLMPSAKCNYLSPSVSHSSFMQPACCPHRLALRCTDMVKLPVCPQHTRGTCPDQEKLQEITTSNRRVLWASERTCMQLCIHTYTHGSEITHNLDPLEWFYNLSSLMVHFCMQYCSFIQDKT